MADILIPQEFGRTGKLRPSTVVRTKVAEGGWREGKLGLTGQIASGHRSALVAPWRRPPHRPLSATHRRERQRSPPSLAAASHGGDPPFGHPLPRRGRGARKNRPSKPG